MGPNRGGGSGGGKGGAVKFDKLGRPLNFGTFKNGRDTNNKSSGGKGGGKGGKGSKGSGSKGGGKGGAKGSGGKGSGGKGGSSGGKGGSGRSGSGGGSAGTPRPPPPPPPPPKKEDGSIAVGMGRANELLVREALQATRLGEELLTGGEYRVGQKVLAVYEDEETGEREWYDAVVEAVGESGEDWIEVYFYDYDYTDTLLLDDVMPRPETSRRGSQKPGGAQGSRMARVPPVAASHPHRAQREALPAFEHRESVLAAVRSSQVVVIEGETGCGKSTQVPQYVLEDAAARGEPCSIVCTQPRRISALGVSERVASERGEAVGGVVGYSIRLDSKASAATALLFCTSGILTRR